MNCRCERRQDSRLVGQPSLPYTARGERALFRSHDKSPAPAKGFDRSSGKMGYALAEAARARGADVLLVSGPTALQPPGGVELLAVETAEDMRKAILSRLAWAHAVIMAAAVEDAAPIEHDDLIRVPHRREPVRDYEHGPMGHETIDRFLHQAL